MGLVQSNTAQNGSNGPAAAADASCSTAFPATDLLADVTEQTSVNVPVAKNAATDNARVPARPAKLGDPVPMNDVVAEELALRRTQEADAAQLVEGHCSVYNSELARRGVPVLAARDCIDAERQRYMDARVRMRMARKRGVACSQLPCGKKVADALADDKRRLDAALDQRDRRNLLNKRPTILESSIATSRNTDAASFLPTTNRGAKYAMLEQLQQRVQS